MHTGLWKILLLQSLCLKTAFSTNQCSPCKCCNKGYHGCRENSCLEGCIDGHFGDKCRHACPINCLTCSDYNSCIDCKYGYYGQTCKCTDRCQTCTTHSCPDCKHGYYGTWCEEKCLENCLSCSRGSSCTICKDGYYNYILPFDCRYVCKANCKACSSNDTCTLCTDGKYNGRKYDRSIGPQLNDCSLNCKPECVSCTSYYNCNRCVEGRYNNHHRDCRETCQRSCATCVSWNNCTACTTGWYGLSCQHSCGRGCIGHHCNKITGTCTCRSNFQGYTCNQCMSGHYGSNCEMECKGCEYGTCNIHGICLNGCKQGFTGARCDQCEAGKYGQTCTGECPTNCEVCITAANCTACKQGYFGQTCLYKCPSSCRSCASDTLCNLCKSGYNGQTCTDRCATHCQNKICYQNNGTCVSCNAGFYGMNCEMPCPVSCANNICDSFGKCKLCKKGYYGSTCTTKCPDNCKDGECNKDSGECSSCIDGYYSNTCNVPCSSNCKQGTSCRKSDGICKKCASGFSQYNCDHPCGDNCKECHRSNPYFCTKCKDGRYGIAQGYGFLHCRHSCSQNCLNATCNNITGFCDHGCIDGFSGLSCTYACPKNCKNNKCFIGNRTCIDGCIDGYGGRYCKCPFNCECRATGQCMYCKGDFENAYKNCECSKKFCLDSTCSRCNSSTFYAEKGVCCPCSKTCKNSECETASKCSSGCEAGYHGDDCFSKCKDIDAFCVECSGNYTKTSGICLKCNVGYYFEKVSNRCNTCPMYCADTVCNPVNGACMQGCIDGRWGDTCERNCSSSCQQCQQSTGKCLICKGGKYLSNCTEECSENCNSTSGVEICSIENGACLYGCSSFSKYGMYCEKDCSSSCLNQKCDWKTGHCLFGCNSGFHGKSCENQCSIMCSKVDKGNSQCNESTGYCFGGCNDGWYGVLCDQKCGEACINKTCDRESGNCLLGCTDGYKGSKCIQALKGTEDGGKTEMTLGLAAGIVSVVLIIIGIIIVFSIRKRRNNKAMGKGHNSDENRHDNTAVTFSDLQAGEIEIEQNDAVYARPNKPKKREEESMATNKTNNDVATINVIDTDRKREMEQNDAVYARPNKPKKREVDESMAINNTNNDVAAISATYINSKSDNNKQRSAGDPHNKGSVTDSDNDSGSKTFYDENTKSDDDNFSERKTHIKPPITAKSTAVYENSGIRTSAFENSRARHNTRQSTSSVLEIEEDLSNLTALTCTSSRALSQEDSRTKETEADYAYYNVADVKKRKVPLDKLEEYVSELTRKDFEEEFDKLPAGLIKPYTESQKKANLTKNRYKGIYPYDKTRVVLTEEGSDYINASFIDGYKKIKAYIASIGPTYKYMEDMSPFWRMVWQEKVGKIVMLTNLSEAGEPKCDQYWPEKDCSKLFLDIRVTSDREEIYAEYTIRSFTLQKDSEVRSTVHAHFTAWPDKGTPDDVTSLVEFRQKVNSFSTDLDGPILVHCSAGIGRTGTYISIDSLVQEGEAEGGVDIYACVRNLREHRVNMVQTAGQYQYLHNAVVHTLTFGCKPIKVSKFRQYMTTHTTEHLGNQFQHLQASIEVRSDEETEAVRLNKRLTDKNRTDADIPGGICRPRIHLRRKQGMSGYINALYINSFRTKNRFLVAQTPLPNTVEDFLTLIVQENVSCIVTLEPSLNGNKTVGTYYPDDSQLLKVGSCTVQSEKVESTDQHVQRKLNILHQGKSTTQEVTVTNIQFTKWIDRQKTPGDPKMFVRFVKDVEMKCDGNDKERPILVHCLTGAEKSGLFCVVSILLEKIQLEQEISVVNTVRQVKNRRHKSIPNKEQYIFCHQCLDEYLKT